MVSELSYGAARGAVDSPREFEKRCERSWMQAST